MNSIALTGLGIILLFIVLILKKISKKTKDYLLALVFILIGFELVFRYINFSISSLYNNWLVALDLFYWVLFGPVLYLYCDFVIYEYRRFKMKDLLHFIPLLLLFVPYTGYLINNTGNTGFFTFINNGNLLNRIILIIWDYITPVYFGFIVIKLFKHKRNATAYFSNLRKKDLVWLLYLSSGYSLYLIIAISLNFINQILNIEIPFVDVDTSIIPLNIYVFGLGIYGYKQEGIFNEAISLPHQVNKEILKRRKQTKYYRSGLSNEESLEIVQTLKTLMETEKPFLDYDLTIVDLSKLIDTTIHKLSQVINESFHKNFFELINEYRIKEVIKMLKDPKNKHLKIISMAYDCGFNSKSAFYSAFKNYTKITPTEYRNKLQKEREIILSN